MLPKTVCLPPESVALAHGQCSYHYEAWRYVVGTLRALPEVRVEFDAAEAYWRRAVGSLVTVCVPGADNHHLDRGQHQLMGLGVCTISPQLFMAPLGDRPIAGEHYVACRDDYADLVERIEWCREHREECRALGRRAREFFQTHSTPQAIWRYIAARLAQTKHRAVGS